MKKVLLWAVPLFYLVFANTVIQTTTELAELDAYIIYKVGFALLLLSGVLITSSSKAVGTSLTMNVSVIKYLWIFIVFAGVQIGLKGFNVDTTILLKYLLLALAIGVIEEVIFRGIFFNMLSNQSPKNRVLYSSALFAAIHLLNFLTGMPLTFVALQLFAAFSIGLVFGVARSKDSSIWMVVLAHALINFSDFASVGLNTTPQVNMSEVLMWLLPSLVFFTVGIVSLGGLSKDSPKVSMG